MKRIQYEFFKTIKVTKSGRRNQIL